MTKGNVKGMVQLPLLSPGLSKRSLHEKFKWWKNWQGWSDHYACSMNLKWNEAIQHLACKAQLQKTASDDCGMQPAFLRMKRQHLIVFVALSQDNEKAGAGHNTFLRKSYSCAHLCIFSMADTAGLQISSTAYGILRVSNQVILYEAVTTLDTLAVIEIVALCDLMWSPELPLVRDLLTRSSFHVFFLFSDATGTLWLWEM